MTDVKWIKLMTDVFNNRKIKQIETMPDGDSIIVIWFKLLCLAANINDQGRVYFTEELPYTEQMIATEFNRPLTTVQLALRTFEEFGMIEIIDQVINVSSWEKYQNVDSLERIREKNRLRQAKHRKKLKALPYNVTDNVTVTQSNAVDIEEDKERDKEKEKESRVNYQLIADMYNETCVSFPRLTTLSDARKKAIKARLSHYSLEDFKTLFTKAQASSFLKGGNSRDWKANFDWLIKDANMAKVLDGNYDDRPQGNALQYNTPAVKPVDDMTQQQLKTIEERQQKALESENMEKEYEQMLKEGKIF